MAATDEAGAMVAALVERFGACVRAAEPLARHSTFGVGGPADAWVTVASEVDAVALVTLAVARGYPLMVVGNGTNVLYADSGIRGIVLQMALDQWSVAPRDDGGALLVAGAGVSLPKLVNDLAARGLTGLEWGAGVPGTIGGAIVSNAGAHSGDIAATIQSARVLSVRGASAHARGNVTVSDMDLAALGLAYRHSRFRSHRRITFDDNGRPTVPSHGPIDPTEMILAGTFLVARAPVEEVRARVAAYRRHRKETQPVQGSAGSVFKNPLGDHAGRLIEAAGLKGTTVGGAQISPVHANFIVNAGGATARDVVALIALARRTVRERFGVQLELEVELRGAW
ncbi:MAG TPA: UDP-N-acetylmuramate dehydrogenase [Ktedonobacterales bacterium]|nr:UDP-N-acetylmuramate dehydrogenase [Ktedonobacterales bacterium]